MISSPTIMLPGEDLIQQGMQDLTRGIVSTASLLVAIGASRLRGLGLPLPEEANLPPHPEKALYRLLGAQDPRGTHSRYNALLRRLVRFEHALEQKSRQRR